MVDIYAPTAHDALTLEELELYHRLMAYRATAGLPAIPLSVGLTETAGRHAVDTRENIWRAGLELPSGANLHSWSDAPYYGDHSEPEVMWTAPQRLETSYDGYGFEISAAGYGDIAAALAGWQGSAGHNTVIMNLGAWSNIEWSAIGIGVISDQDSSLPYGGKIYHVWFGREADAGGPPEIQDNAGDDAIQGTEFADLISSVAGADLITSSAGNDEIRLGGDTMFGDDLVAFNVSSATQVGTGVQLALTGRLRIDAVVDGGAGAADHIRLTDEADAFFLHDAFSDFHADLTLTTDSTGRDSAARFQNIERISGEGGNDIIDLTSPDYSLAGVSIEIDGGAGADVIWGSDADEVIRGGIGDDTLFGGAGDNALTGGAGADKFEFTRTSHNTIVTDFDADEGDRLVFYNAGGAAFDLDSVQLTETGLRIEYATSSGTEELEVRLALLAADFDATLAEITNAIDIV